MYSFGVVLWVSSACLPPRIVHASQNTPRPGIPLGVISCAACVFVAAGCGSRVRSFVLEDTPVALGLASEMYVAG